MQGFVAHAITLSVGLINPSRQMQRGDKGGADHESDRDHERNQAEDHRVPPPLVAPDGDNHVGNIAEAEVDIADVSSLLHHFPEPLFCCVVVLLKGTGTHVGKVVTVFADGAQVDECRSVAGVEILEDPTDRHRIRSIPEAQATRGKLQRT